MESLKAIWGKVPKKMKPFAVIVGLIVVALIIEGIKNGLAG